MEQLRREIKSGYIKGVYLFTGEEKFLIKSYENAFIKACLKNGSELDLSVFEGKNSDPGKITEAADTPPFFNEKRLVLIKNSELFTSKRKDDGEKIASFINDSYGENAENTAIMLFVEENVDKRGKAFKALNKLGRVVVFEPLGEGRLISWIMEQLRKNGLSASSETASYLIRVCGGSMENASNEIAKLSSYKEGGIVSKDDIDTVCSKTAEARIFDLIDAVAAKDRAKALKIYAELLAAKEQPIGILAMLSRQFRLILKCKLFSIKSISERETAERLKEKPYSVKIATRQSKAFPEGILKKAALDCVECDTQIKTGLIGDRLGVEMLIIKYTQ